MSQPMVNELGWSVINGIAIAMAALLICNGLWIFCRWQMIKGLEVPLPELGLPLSFHSPDDTPRNFVQFPYQSSVLGTLLMYAWVLYFVIGYVSMMVLCWFVYPSTYPNGLGAPPCVIEAFGSWNGLVAPWLVVYTVTHVIWGVIIAAGESLRTQFMIPVRSFEDATHVIIEEDTPFMTDEFLVDPDTSHALNVGQKVMASKSLNTKYSTLAGRMKQITTRTVIPVFVEEDGTRRIEYTCVRYSYCEDTGCFQPRGIQDYEAKEVHEAYRAGGLSSDKAVEVYADCGQNEINVKVPSVLQSLISEFMDFTKVVASMGTWAYMVFSVANLGMVWFCITFGTGAYKALCITRPNQVENAELAKLEAECDVLRDGKWKKVQANEIVLGDVIRVDDLHEPKLPCDGILVEGTIVTNESMLTGEPMPVQKLPTEDSEFANVTKRNIAYAGTKVLQSNGPADGKAVLIATAIGALTTRGQLVRMVLFPCSVRFKYLDQLPYVYLLLFVYMLILVLIYVIFVEIGTWVALYLIIINTCAMSLNPMLPVSMVMGQAVASERLKSKLEISCLQPGRIPIAGKISTMVFDKTGTITKEGMDFTAVVPVSDRQFQAQINFDSKNPKCQGNRDTVNSSVPVHLRHALAACHTVSKMRDGMLIGNAVEVSMVKTCGWDLGEQFITSQTGEKLEVVKKLDFDHHRMTSGVVIRRLDTNALEVYIKGSYEKIKAISSPQSVPANYDSMTANCAKEGYYTLGIAMNTLPAHLPSQALADMTRDQLESSLSICGLLLFINEMKPDSPEAFRALEAGSVHSVICTGDNALTGISIGKKCGVIKTSDVLLGDMEHGTLVWRSTETNKVEEVERNPCQLAVTHSAWRYLHDPANEDEIDGLWTRIAVFARMKPEDKINVVTFLQSKKLVVGMAGDGGNDCGGLRAAHAGMALSDAEASMVSPFSSGRDGKSLMTVVDMIREGRACLATNLATFRFFMIYGFFLTFVRTWLLLLASLSMGEYVWLTNDIIFGITMVSMMTRTHPTKELIHYRPTATLFGLRTASAIFFPLLTGIVGLVISEAVLWGQDWYIRVNALTDLHIPGELWMLKGDNHDSALGVYWLFVVLSTAAFVNSYGGDFRKNVIFNWSLCSTYAVTLGAVAFMILGGSTQFSCIWRTSCDTVQSLASGSLTPLMWFSKLGGAGLVGGCFLGPDLKNWQVQIGPQPPDNISDWIPSLDRTDPSQSCKPPIDTEPPFDTEEFGCVGLNNCYSSSFNTTLVILLALWIITNHLFVKVVLQGPIARAIRSKDMCAQSPFLEDHTDEDDDDEDDYSDSEDE